MAKVWRDHEQIMRVGYIFREYFSVVTLPRCVERPHQNRHNSERWRASKLISKTVNSNTVKQEMKLSDTPFHDLCDVGQVHFDAMFRLVRLHIHRLKLSSRHQFLID